MVISENAAEFSGLPIRPYDAAKGLEPGAFAPRLSFSWDDETSVIDQIRALGSDPRAGTVSALVIGAFGEPGDPHGDDIIEVLVELAPRFPSLKALWLGEMTFEECEISWIQVGDITPLFSIEGLQELRVRGGEVQLSPVSTPTLRKLVFESGGLPGVVPEALAKSSLPALEHLELWLGTDEYGGPNDIASVAPLLQTTKLPALRHLGLRNSVISDAIAAELVRSPLLKQLTSLDLSLGTLGDEGVNALANAPSLGAVRSIDISHHYAGDDAVGALAARVSELIDRDEEVDRDEDHRYVAHSE